jgi:hypothetical protein
MIGVLRYSFRDHLGSVGSAVLFTTPISLLLPNQWMIQLFYCEIYSTMRLISLSLCLFHFRQRSVLNRIRISSNFCIFWEKRPLLDQVYIVKDTLPKPNAKVKLDYFSNTNYWTYSRNVPNTLFSISCL